MAIGLGYWVGFVVDKFAVGMPELIGCLIGFGLVVADFVRD